MHALTTLLATSAAAIAFGFLPAQAQAQDLTNLTIKGANVKSGNKRCPNADYYLYSGGKADNFAGVADMAFPSPNLLQFIPPGGPIVAYDTPMNDGRFGDSFNLQNGRSVCYAVIEFRTELFSSNDGLHFGHVAPGGAPFNIVGSVVNPGWTGAVQSYALTANGLALLSAQTMNTNPLDTTFDLYLQDDTMLDYFKLYVWYGTP